MANPLITRETIEEEVRKALGATLRREAGPIALDASIMTDLGATSIDFLDINFRLENAFGIQLATQLLLDHVEEEVGEGKAIDRDNRITAAAARMLSMHLGELPGLEAGMYADDVATLVTPEVLVKSVLGITDRLPEACTHCTERAWKTEDGRQVVCGACGKPAEYPDGDTLTQEWIRKVEAEHQIFAGA
ncbi:MAG: acyl carrier protein [Planctomycetota bacterium]